jgi:hypothetical protein
VRFCHAPGMGNATRRDVAQGYYREIQRRADTHPEVGLYATRSFFVEGLISNSMRPLVVDRVHAERLG